ncbi:MAG: hypothetical protein HY361_03670 [Candidatus Aenigmarchaeota archaeon]|nr:hypothetical protein [Candidatus Aenigmarchaeota archaeon]
MNNKGMHRTMLLFIIGMILIILILAFFSSGLYNIIKEYIEKRITIGDK